MNKILSKFLSSALVAVLILGINNSIPVKAAELTVDQIYAQAYAATQEAITSGSQKSINKARIAILAMINTDASWAVGEFSYRVDLVQQPILVKTVDAILKAQSNPSQSSVNAAKAAIDPDLPSEWRSSYSSAVDAVQQSIMKSAVDAVDKAEKSKLQSDIDKANSIIKDIQTASELSIVSWVNTLKERLDAVEVLPEIQSITIKNYSSFAKFNYSIDNTSTNYTEYTISDKLKNTSVLLISFDNSIDEKSINGNLNLYDNSNEKQNFDYVFGSDKKSLVIFLNNSMKDGKYYLTLNSNIKTVLNRNINPIKIFFDVKNLETDNLIYDPGNFFNEFIVKSDDEFNYYLTKSSIQNYNYVIESAKPISDQIKNYIGSNVNKKISIFLFTNSDTFGNIDNPHSIIEKRAFLINGDKLVYPVKEDIRYHFAHEISHIYFSDRWDTSNVWVNWDYSSWYKEGFPEYIAKQVVKYPATNDPNAGTLKDTGYGKEYYVESLKKLGQTKGINYREIKDMATMSNYNEYFIYESLVYYLINEQGRDKFVSFLDDIYSNTKDVEKSLKTFYNYNSYNEFLEGWKNYYGL